MSELNVCDVCNKETVACLILCPDCNEKKQGALKELYSLLYYCDKAQVDEKAIKRKINKRIKELEGKGVEK